MRRAFTKLRTRFYYVVKPVVPPRVRLALRRRRNRKILGRYPEVWPVSSSAGVTPDGWPGWPEGQEFAFVLSHDVESQAGLDRVRDLAEVDLKHGFRSSFNFIPEGPYQVPGELRNWLVDHGFEVGVHDLNHDGHLFSSRRRFREKAERINGYLDDWGAVGFRSAFMLCKLDWLKELKVRYDSSTFDTDPFEPQPEGADTIFPFWVDRGDGSGFIELPYTLSQDSTLFIVGDEETGGEIWRRKLGWIRKQGGMALLNVHPDYIAFDNEPATGRYPLKHYEDFLMHVKENQEGRYWQALPKEVGEYCGGFRPENAPFTGKRVCMVSYSFYESDNRVMRYAKALAERGDHVDVIALSCGDHMPSYEMMDGVHVHRVQRRERNEKSKLTFFARILRFLIVSSAVLTRKHLKHRYDLVHVHNIPDFMVFCAWLPRLTGVRVILDIHDIVPEFFASKFGEEGEGLLFKALKAVEWVSCHFAHHVIISNHLWHEKVTKRSVAPGRCSVFINYVDGTVFHPRSRTRDDGKFIMVYPGGLQWHQGLDIAIGAFARIADEVPGAEFHIYGQGGVREELEAQAESLGIGDRVLFFDPKPMREIARVMADADLGVVGKRADSFGNEAYSTKIMEFMSSGLPAVVSGTRIDRYYFDDSQVRFFTSGDEVELAEAMKDLYEHEPLRRELVRNALAYAERNCWDRHKTGYLKLVDDLVSGTGSAAEFEPFLQTQ